MANNFAGAIRAGTMAAGRLLRQLEIHDAVSLPRGSIDVFGTISSLNIPLLIRPLNGLLGAFLREPTPGILVTSERRLGIQRFTAAHELGHYIMEHHLSLDDPQTVLKRAPGAREETFGFQETEANAFAAAFLMPKWLITSHCISRGWSKIDLENPHVAYQLSLRLGVSYEASCRTLESYRLITPTVMNALLSVSRRDIKAALLGKYRPTNYYGDVWLLTDQDRGVIIDGSQDDCFVMKLTEHASAGYVWDFHQFVESGFAIVDDNRESLDTKGVGGANFRTVTAVAQNKPVGPAEIVEKRPWRESDETAHFKFDFNLTGPEPRGLSRAERLRTLEDV